jgi:hypothetical protein
MYIYMRVRPALGGGGGRCVWARSCTEKGPSTSDQCRSSSSFRAWVESTPSQLRPANLWASSAATSDASRSLVVTLISEVNRPAALPSSSAALSLVESVGSAESIQPRSLLRTLSLSERAEQVMTENVLQRRCLIYQ